MEVVANYPTDPPTRDHLLDETAPIEERETRDTTLEVVSEQYTSGQVNRRNSSSRSTLEDPDLSLDINELEDSDGRNGGTPRKRSLDSGQSDVDYTSDQIPSNDRSQRRRHRSDQLDRSSRKSSDRSSVENGSGRGSGDSCADVEDLASQLVQLQTMVKEMREGFTGAMEALTKVQYGDRILEQKVDSNKSAHEQQLADVVQMVLALKCEFGGIVSQLAAATDNQQQLRAQVDHLQYERDILLEELEQHSVISENVRQKYHSGRRRPNGLTRANDSSLSVLLERARSMFNTTNNGNSDQDSGVNTYHQGDNSTCGEVTPPNVSPMVQSYIAGLHNGNQEDALEDNYESDSSLTQAANKSLDMSRSLGDKCAELTNVDSSDDEEVTGSGRNKNQEIQKNRALDTTSPHFKRPSSPKRTPPHERNVKDLARSRVAYEVLETERKYCSCLWTILDHFANPLKEAAIIPIKETSVLFPECLSRIYEHHCAFLQRLEERIANWKCYGVIGDVFSTFIDNSDYDVLVQYRAYVTEFPSALGQLKKSCRHSLRFRKFLRKCQTDPICEGLDLSAFLLTPVQRIPRYVLLLKQLMKYTLPEHIDYYYVEACLAKLGTFLAQLNDSIEHSMKIVADDVTPKSKRKLRVGSLRSSNSSFEGIHLSSATKDSGVQSSCDNTSILSGSSNNGRLFQVSIVKDSDRPLGVPAERPYVVPERALGVPDPNSSLNGGNYDSRTMPSMGTRRQRERLRRPKSSDPQNRNTGEKERSFDETRFSPAEEHIFLMPRKVAPRPSSVAGDSSMGDSFKGQTPSGYMPHLKNGSFNARRQDLQSPQFRIPSPPVAVSSQSDVRTNTATTSMRTLPVTNSREIVIRPNHSTPQVGSGSFHKSLMNIPGLDYGIYGNEPEDINAYTPIAAPDANAKRRALKLSHRSRSQGQLPHAHHAMGDASSGTTSPSSTGNVIIVPGTTNLSQHHINMALARSMADDVSRRQHQQQVLNPPLPSSDTSQSSAQVKGIPLQQQRRIDRPRSCLLPGDSAIPSSQQDPELTSLDHSNMRPRSSSTGHQTAVMPVNSDLPDRPRENVWEDTEDSILNGSDLLGGKRKDVRKKKKDKQKKVDESLTSEGGRRKGGFKDSLRNIFFKKRGSKVVEIGGGVEYPDNSEGDSQGPLPAQIPPPKDSLIVTSRNEAPDFSTYEDENGDPCSAV